MGTQIPFVLETPKNKHTVLVCVKTAIWCPCFYWISLEVYWDTFANNFSEWIHSVFPCNEGETELHRHCQGTDPAKRWMHSTPGRLHPAIGSVETLKFIDCFLSSVPMRRKARTEFGDEQFIEPENFHKEVASYVKRKCSGKKTTLKRCVWQEVFPSEWRDTHYRLLWIASDPEKPG